MALIYRAYFAFLKNPRLTSKGDDVSAIFGFLNTLLEIQKKHNPSHIAVAFDLSVQPLDMNYIRPIKQIEMKLLML